MNKAIKYGVFLISFLIFFLNIQAQECNVLSKANDITPNKYCAPVHVDWKITYRGVMGVLDPTTVTFDVDWGDGTVVNIPYGAGAGMVHNIGGDDYEAVIEHIYPDAIDGSCNYHPRVWLRIDGRLCSSSVQEQNVTVWDVDNANGGELNIEERTIYVCVGEDTTVVFRDVSDWNCVPPEEEDNVNNQSRWIQWEYGTGATTLTDVFIDGVPYAGTFSDAVNKLPGPVVAPQLPYSRSRTIYVPPTDAGDVGKQFEVTLNNWNYCNQYPGNDPVSQTAIIIVVDIPTASITFNTPADTDVCLGATVRLTGHPGGGIWSSPSGGFSNPNNGNFNTNISGPGVHEMIYTYVGTGDCIAEARAFVTVYPNPSIFVSMGDPTYLCPGTSFTFNNTVVGGTAPYTYTWEKDTDPLSATDILNPQFTTNIPDTYKLRLRVVDNHQCSALRNRNIVVSDVDIDFDINELTLCEGESSELNTNVNGGSGSYTYVWSGDIAYLSGPDSKPLFTATDTGSFKLYCKVIDDNGCDMNDSVTIRVNKKPDPVIVGGDRNICGLTTDVETASGSGTTDWTLVNGPGSIHFTDLGGNNTEIRVNKEGVYKVRFSEEESGCNGYDEIDIKFIKNPEPFAGNDAAVCNNKIILDALPSVGTGSWTIASGPGALTFDDQFDEETEVTTGTYGVYKLVWREDNNSCVATDTVEITFNEVPTPDYGMVHNGSCSPLDVHFENNSIGGSTYLWHFQGASYSNDFEPDYSFDLPSDDDTTFVIELEVTSAAGCKATVNKTLHVNPNPLAKINTAYKPACSPVDVTLENGSAGGVKYTWDYGDGDTDVLFDKSDVTHNFVNASPGNQVQSFLVNLVAENSYGCTDTASTYMMVYPEAHFEFNFSGNPVCESSNVLIYADGGAKEYKWDFGNGTLASGANPTVYAEYYNNGFNDTTFIVNLDATSYYGCSSNYQDSLVVHPVVVAGFIDDQDQVAGKLNLTLTDDSKNGKYVNIKWGDGDIDSVEIGVDFPVSHLYENKDFFPKLFNLTYIVESEMGCFDSTAMQVRVYPEFYVDFNMPANGCSPVEVQFENTSTPAGTFEWDFGDGSPVETRLFPVHNFVNTKINGEPDTFTVRLTGTSMWGFTDTMYKNIVIFPVPEAAWNITATSNPDDTVYVENITNGGDVYYWDLDDGNLDTTNVLSTKVKWFGNVNPEQITKNISLTTVNSYGCRDSIYDNVTVNPIIIADFVIDSVSCSPMSTVATSTSTGAVFYEWSIDGGPFVRGDVHFPVEIENNTGAVQVHQLTLKARSVYGDQDQITKDLTVYPVPVARISGISQDKSPLNLTLENQTTGGDTYLWVFGGMDSLSMNTSDDVNYTFLNNTQIPATHIVDLKAENVYGCLDSTSEMVIVYPEVKADFNCPLEGCPPLQVSFMDKSVGGLFYEWTIEGVNTFYGRILNYEFKNETLADKFYNVRLNIESAYGFRDTITKTIRIKPVVKSVFDATSAGMSPFTSVLTNNSVNALESHWNFGDASPDEILAGAQSTTHDYFAGISPEAYDVTLNITSPEGCEDSSLSTVMVYPALTVDFESDSIGCSPFDVDFTNLSIGADLFIWTFGDGSGKWMSRNAFHRFENDTKVPVQYEVQLIGQSKYGFIDTVKKVITVNPTPYALFDITPEGDSPMEAHITDRSEDAVSVVWNMGDGDLLTDPGLSFTHIYMNTTGAPLSHNVVQRVQNTYGCFDSMSQTVNVFPTINAAFDCDSIGCTPLTVAFRNLSHGALRYRWDFGDGSDVLESSIPVHVFENPYPDSVLVYRVMMVALSQFGYSDTAYKDITVYPVPVTAFALDIKKGCAPLSINFENNSLGQDVSIWTIGDDSFNTGATEFTQIMENTSFLPKYFEVRLEVANTYGCSSYATDIIEVFPQTKADFGGDTVGCSPLTAIYMNKSKNANDFVWYIDGVADYRQNPVLPFDNLTENIESHSIKLVAESAYGCSDSIEKILQISPEPIVDFEVLPAQGFSPLNVVINNYSDHADTYIWNLGEGDPVVMNNNSDLEHTYINETLAPSVRKINLLAENSFGCTGELSKSVDVYPLVRADFEYTGNGCSPLSVDFKNLSQGATHFEWEFGDGTPVSVATNPTHTFENKSLNDVKQFTVKLLSYSQYGMADTAIKVIEVYPTPVSGFKANIISGCSPVDLVITNECKGLGDMEWELGDGSAILSGDSVFRKTYENMTTMPEYHNLSVRITNEYGCSNRTQKALEVLPGVVAKFDCDTAGCSPLTIAYRNKSVNASEYYWDLADGTTTMDAMPVKQYVNKTSEDFRENVVLVAKTSYGCTDTFKKRIAVYPEPDFSFEILPAEVTMPSADVTINASIKNKGPWRFIWDFGDGSVSDSLSPGVHTYDKWGNYNVKVDITDDRCSDLQVKGVVVNPSVPIAEFSGPTVGCTPVTMVFANHSQGMIASLWDFGDGTLSSEENPSHTYFRPGAYDVKLTVFNDVGNADTLVRRVNVYEGVKSDFLMTPHVVHSFSQEISFSNFSQNGYEYIWEFGDGDMSHDFEPKKRYSHEGIYDISLTSISKDGCRDTMLQKSALEVSDVYNVRYPNVFMPIKSGPQGGTYDDGDTHIFYPLIDRSMLKTYRLTIFDRWGLMVFETRDVSVGWDGYYNGKLCQQGVYVWKVHAEFEDGNEVVKTGDVTLLK